MAKNIFQTKKRVSHFQRTPKHFDGENELFGCKDYVSSIIQDMDSNFSYIQSGYFKKGIQGSETHVNPSEDFSSIPILKMPPPASSTGCVQMLAKPKRTKSYSLSRKFPLMEKTQKALKQLKHNQNIPKPRAHLAKIQKSPAKSKAKCLSPKISVVKKKEIVSVKSKINNIQCNVTPTHSSELNPKPSNSNKGLKNDLTSKHSNPEKIKDNISEKSSLSDIPEITDSNKETNCMPESDGDTSDSEYERFLKKSKKGLQKKSSKKQKLNKRKSKLSTKNSKRKKIAQSSAQKGSYDCDNITESSKFSTSEMPINIQEDSYLENDLNSSDHDDIPEVPSRDSSSESDDDHVATSRNQHTFSEAWEVKPVNETMVLSSVNSYQSYPNLNALELNINSDFESSKKETQILNPVQLSVKHVSETEISSASDMPQLCQSQCFAESNMNSGIVQNENLIDSIKIEHNSLPSNLVIDICDSDDESSNGELNPPESSCGEDVQSTVVENISKSLADSEESDLEIIEEVKKPVQTICKYSASVINKTSDCLKNTVSEKKLDASNACVDMKSIVKTEPLDNKSSVNLLPVVESQNEAKIGDKHDVVYRTEICRTKISEQKTIVSSHCSTAQNVPSKGSFPPNSGFSVVKHEINTEEDIIILDSIHSTKLVDASNLPLAKTENIKSEPSSESKLKLLDTVDSEPYNNEAKEWGKIFQDVIPVSSVELYKWYKMEYDTYMEMKKSNADVEASLKNLQARQAQKIQYVRKLLHKAMKDKQEAKPLIGSAPISLGESSKDFKDFTSVNVQNDSDISPNNSFSPNSQIILPSAVVQDVKPDVDKLKEGLQSKFKIESNEDLNSKKIIPKIESDNKQTLKLLNEKCSVCGKDAVAACQRCAKVFFCSHECGRKFWIGGHVNVCGTK